jgi:hypothetical protein
MMATRFMLSNVQRFIGSDGPREVHAAVIAIIVDTQEHELVAASGFEQGH